MNKRAIGVVLGLLLVPALAWAGVIPDTLTVEPGRLTPLSVDSGGKPFSYAASNNLTVLREYTPDEAGAARLWLIGYEAGTGTLAVAIATDATKPPALAVCSITLGKGPQPPPPPPPPPPADALYKDLKGLYQADGDPSKASTLRALTRLYWYGNFSSGDPTLTTLGAFHQDLQEKSAKVIQPDSLKPLRTRVAKELQSLGTDPKTPFTNAKRDEASALFTRLAQVTEKILAEASPRLPVPRHRHKAIQRR